MVGPRRQFLHPIIIIKTLNIAHSFNYCIVFEISNSKQLNRIENRNASQKKLSFKVVVVTFLNNQNNN